MFEVASEIGKTAAIIIGVVAVVIFLLSLLKRRVSFDFAGDLGTSYVLKTKNVRKAYTTYMELREKQSRDGIIISRVFPDRLRQRYGFDRSEFLWLSYEKTEKSIDPSDLEKLEYLIHEFVSSHENAVVLLDGVEYLILQNSFESTLKFLQSLNDQIILNGATLIMPLDPKSLDRKELSLLERELETYQVDYRLSRFFE
jgi:hypothetical protein